MKIVNYYRGSTDRLSGFVYDTDAKTYKTFTLSGDEWTETKTRNNTVYSCAKPQFKKPGDIDYFFPTKTDMTARLDTITRLGFTEDNHMQLDFGICTL